MEHSVIRFCCTVCKKLLTITRNKVALGCKMEDSQIKDIKDSISDVLERKFKDPLKRRVFEYPDRLNFACPYCGDSTVSKLKKRGNVFLKDMSYHCFNCGKHTSIIGFLHDFGETISPDVATGIQGIMKGKRRERKNSDVLDLSVLSELEKISVTRDKIKSKYRLCEVTPATPMYEYVKNRCLLHKNINFLYSKFRNELFVLNLTKDGKIAGFQTRSFSENKSKYKTYNIERIYKELETPLKTDNLEILNSMSTVFNVLTVDLLSPLYVFEGGMDSFFIKNSIGICGVRREVDVINDLPNCYYFFDNDTDGFKETIKKVEEGHYAFMWGKFLKDFDINGKIKDFNDLVIWVSKNRKGFDYKQLKNYFTNDIMDVYNI